MVEKYYPVSGDIYICESQKHTGIYGQKSLAKSGIDGNSEGVGLRC